MKTKQFNQVVESPDMMGPFIEEWRDIEGFESLYQISNYGRVKSLARVIFRNDGIKKTLPEKMRKPVMNPYGYKSLMLYKNNKGRGHLIHRLIAICFIPNPKNKPCINHKDGNKLNNFINNLEWCTYAENNKHAYDLGLKIGAALGVKGADNFNSKPIEQINPDTNEVVNKFVSITDAGDKTGIQFKNISSVCRGKRPKAGGYKWRFAND